MVGWLVVWLAGWLAGGFLVSPQIAMIFLFSPKIGFPAHPKIPKGVWDGVGWFRPTRGSFQPSETYTNAGLGRVQAKS